MTHAYPGLTQGQNGMELTEEMRCLLGVLRPLKRQRIDENPVAKSSSNRSTAPWKFHFSLKLGLLGEMAVRSGEDIVCRERGTF